MRKSYFFIHAHKIRGKGTKKFPYMQAYWEENDYFFVFDIFLYNKNTITFARSFRHGKDKILFINHQKFKIMKNAKDSLDLNTEVVRFVEKLLEQHAEAYTNSKFEIICDLTQLCREVCLAILRFLWRHKCKGYKSKTAEICCIHRNTVRDYENFIEP